MRLKWATGLALATGGAIALGVCSFPSEASDVKNLLTEYLLRRQAVDNTADQNLIQNNINLRQAELESQIQSGVTSGQLTTREANELTSDLNKIAADEGRYLVDRNLNPTETNDLVTKLSNFSTKLSVYLTNSQATGAAASRSSSSSFNSYMNKYIGQGPADGVPSNQAFLTANIRTRIAELEGVVDRGVRQGKLNYPQALDTGNQLRAIQEKEKVALNDGRITYQEEQDLVKDLTVLDERLHSYLGDFYPYTSNNRNGDRGRRWGHYKKHRHRWDD